jgi:hypothetical protein
MATLFPGEFGLYDRNFTQDQIFLFLPLQIMKLIRKISLTVLRSQTTRNQYWDF